MHPGVAAYGAWTSAVPYNSHLPTLTGGSELIGESAEAPLVEREVVPARVVGPVTVVGEVMLEAAVEDRPRRDRDSKRDDDAPASALELLRVRDSRSSSSPNPV